MQTYSTNTQPVAVVLADKPLSNNLMSIFGQQDLSSLMIAGSTVIEHLLMELQDLKIKECIIVAQHNAAQIQTQIGDPRRWGMSITVVNYSLSREQVLREYKSLSAPNGLLIIETDRLRSRCLKEFLEQASASEYLLVAAHSASQPLGITLLKDNESAFIINEMPIELVNVKVNQLSTLVDFHRANFDVIASSFTGLEPSVQINSMLGRRQHWTSQVAKPIKPYDDQVMIERHCRVGKGASLYSVILNHNVYVAHNAHLEHTIVMPNAIISAQHSIKDAVIAGDKIYQVNHQRKPALAAA